MMIGVVGTSGAGAGAWSQRDLFPLGVSDATSAGVASHLERRFFGAAPSVAAWDHSPLFSLFSSFRHFFTNTRCPRAECNASAFQMILAFQ